MFGPGGIILAFCCVFWFGGDFYAFRGDFWLGSRIFCSILGLAPARPGYSKVAKGFFFLNSDLIERSKGQ